MSESRRMKLALTKSSSKGRGRAPGWAPRFNCVYTVGLSLDAGRQLQTVEEPVTLSSSPLPEISTPHFLSVSLVQSLEQEHRDSLIILLGYS